MNYTKPAAVVLGEAVNVIEGATLKSISGTDFLHNGKVPVPAYDLDE